MITPRSTVAVLLFTRSAGEEAVHKRFLSHGTRAGNAAVAAQLIDHATTTATQAGVDFVCIDSARQTGSTFGERLAGALQQTFGQGYEQVLAIGNDCPQLDETLLRRAVAAVRENGAVLGPATDGGVYLLGVSRALFEREAWVALPWQTAHLGEELLNLLHEQDANVIVLPALTDVDNEQDLARALRQPLKQRLQCRLRRLRAAVWAVGPVYLLAIQQVGAAAQPHRGPPAN